MGRFCTRCTASSNRPCREGYVSYTCVICVSYDCCTCDQRVPCVCPTCIVRVLCVPYVCLTCVVRVSYVCLTCVIRVPNVFRTYLTCAIRMSNVCHTCVVRVLHVSYKNFASIVLSHAVREGKYLFIYVYIYMNQYTHIHVIYLHAYYSHSRWSQPRSQLPERAPPRKRAGRRSRKEGGVETNWDLIVLGLTGTDTNIIRTRFTVVYSVSFKYKTFVGFILLLSTYVRYFGKNNISMAIV